jgi:hypothetical protein
MGGKPQKLGAGKEKASMSNMVTIESKPAEGISAAPPQSPAPQAASGTPGGLQVTERAIKRIRMAMAKEGVSPEEGGLRLGVMGGGCSGLSYSIKFDTRPRERDRIYNFDGRNADAAGIQLHQSELLALLRLRFVVLLLDPRPRGATGSASPRVQLCSKSLIPRFRLRAGHVRSHITTRRCSVRIAARFSPPPRAIFFRSSAWTAGSKSTFPRWKPNFTA